VELVGVGGLGAWLALKLHFPYTALTPFSLLVYGAAGFYACRAGAAGWIAGAIVGVLDAVTWATFGGIGPQPADPTATPTSKIVTVVFVTLLGALCGFIGARLQRRRARVQ
jgi:Na+/proline symporter